MLSRQDPLAADRPAQEPPSKPAMVVEHAPWASSPRGVSLLRARVRVQRLVDERVGVGVLRARHRADRPARRTRRSAAMRLGVQRLHVRVLDLVLAVDLLGDELGVVDDLDLGGAERRAPGRARAAGRGTRRRCSSRAEQLGGLVERPSPSGVETHGAGRGRARVAPRAAVDVDDDLHSARRRSSRSAGTRRARAARRRSRVSRCCCSSPVGARRGARTCAGR